VEARRRAASELLIDSDHFEAYNDRYGHQAGDQALRRVAQAVGSFVLRPVDVLAR
jgi:diguanylate cyclase (GGDEF)-like protein